MPISSNELEIHLTDKDFSLRLNGAEINRVKDFSLKCEAGRSADLTLHIDVDTLRLD